MPDLSKYGLDYEFKLLEREKYSEKVKSLIKGFVSDLGLKENISEERMITYVQKLRVVARWIPEDFLDPDKVSISKVLEKLQSYDYADFTIVSYVTVIKRFYKWYKGGNKAYPEFVGDIKIRSKRNGLKPEDLITHDELNAIITACVNARDRALFSTLYDSGARIGELLTMEIRDVVFDEFGAILKVTGKTGPRQIRIVGNSVAYLKAWLEDHPDKRNQEGYLFCGLSNRTKGKRLLHANVYAIIRSVVQRAGIKRRIHPHLFRHTRATLLATSVAEAPLESQMGWVHGSRQTSTYVHLSLRDQDNAILKAYGIQARGDNLIREERPIECPRCHELNASDSLVCRNCQLPLNARRESERGEKEKETSIDDSQDFDPVVKEILRSIPESAKIQLLIRLMREVVGDTNKTTKLKDALTK